MKTFNFKNWEKPIIEIRLEEMAAIIEYNLSFSIILKNGYEFRWHDLSEERIKHYREMFRKSCGEKPKKPITVDILEDK